MLQTVASGASRQSVGGVCREPGGLKSDLSQGRESEHVVGLETRVVVSTVGGLRSRSQPPRKSLSRRVSKDSRQEVNGPTTYQKQHHGLAGEMLSDPKRMVVRRGFGWQMRHARGRVAACAL